MNATEAIVAIECIVRAELAFYKDLPASAASNEIPRWKSAMDFLVLIYAPFFFFEAR